MPNFQDAKIFIVKSHTSPKVYVSITTDTRLCAKLSSLRSYHKHDVGEFADLLRAPDVKIELLEKFPCDSRPELLAREKYWKAKYTNLIEKHRRDLREVIVCECGISIFRLSMSRHISSKRHLALMSGRS